MASSAWKEAFKKLYSSDLQNVSPVPMHTGQISEDVTFHKIVDGCQKLTLNEKNYRDAVPETHQFVEFNASYKIPDEDTKFAELNKTLKEAVAYPDKTKIDLPKHGFHMQHSDKFKVPERIYMKPSITSEENYYYKPIKNGKKSGKRQRKVQIPKIKIVKPIEKMEDAGKQQLDKEAVAGKQQLDEEAVAGKQQLDEEAVAEIKTMMSVQSWKNSGKQLEKEAVPTIETVMPVQNGKDSQKLFGKQAVPEMKTVKPVKNQRNYRKHQKEQVAPEDQSDDETKYVLHLLELSGKFQRPKTSYAMNEFEGCGVNIFKSDSTSEEEENTITLLSGAVGYNLRCRNEQMPAPYTLFVSEPFWDDDEWN